MGFCTVLGMKKTAMLAGLLMAGAAMGSGVGMAQTGTLLVANQSDHTLSLIDAKAGKEIATIPVGGVTGHEVVAMPDGKTAFVPIYGNSGVGKPGSNGSSMAVIDLASRKVVATVDFGHEVRPHEPLYEPVSGMLYVTTELDKSVTVIDPKTRKIVGSIPTGQEQSHMLAISKDGKRGYTANVGPGTVSVLDMVGRKTVTVIPVSKTIQRIALSVDDKLVFTSDQTAPKLVVIDTATNTVKTTVALPGMGYGTAVTPDGKWLLVSMPAEKKVAVVDLKAMAVVKTIDVPAGNGEMLVRPDGTMAYLSCPTANQVAAIDLKTWSVAKIIDAGKKADGLGWVK